MPENETDVLAGQVFRDTDKRHGDRTVRVTGFENGSGTPTYVLCVNRRTGRQVKIRKDRLLSYRYKLVQDA